MSHAITEDENSDVAAPDPSAVEALTEDVEEAGESDIEADEELSEDPSLLLHMIGEHDHYDAVALDEEDCAVLHTELHRLLGHGVGHDSDDLRFRPKLALNNALYATGAVWPPVPPALPVPAQSTPDHDDLPADDEPEATGTSEQEQEDAETPPTP